MGRKVFISLLGTGFYEHCNYTFGSFTSSRTRFIQIATLEMIDAMQWKKEDVCFFLLTDKAKTANWDQNQNGRRRPQHDNFVEYKSLKTELEEHAFPFEYIPVAIPEGKDESEMWEIFDVLYLSIEEGDELYIDLTHCFRFIPMLLLVFINYAKFLKHITIKSISYGNYEARNDLKAPIMNMMPLSELQDWTSAADEYLSTGSINKLRALYLPKIKEVIKEKQLAGNTSERNDYLSLKSFIESLDSVIKERLTCQGSEIIGSKNVGIAKKRLSDIQNVNMPQPFKPLLKEISNSLESFDSESNVLNGIKAAKWCMNNGLYQQSVTLLQETVVSHLCMKHNLDWQNKVERAYINFAMYAIVNSKNVSELEIACENDEDKNRKEGIIKQLMVDEEMKRLKDNFSLLTSLRNQYNHGGMLKDKCFNPSNMIDKIKKVTDEIYNKLCL